jgi:hypothetical protein
MPDAHLRLTRRHAAADHHHGRLTPAERPAWLDLRRQRLGRHDDEISPHAGLERTTIQLPGAPGRVDAGGAEGTREAESLV